MPSTKINSVPPEKDNPAPTDPGLGRLVIAMDLLEAFLGDTAEMGFTRLAGVVKEDKTILQEVLTALEDRGYLQRAPDGHKYRLGVRVFELGARFQNSLDIRRAALPELTSLAEQTSESGFLCVRDGDNALCLERVEGRHRARIHALQVGERQPLHWGAAPRALLAGMSDAEISAYAVRTGLPRSTPRTITSLEQLLEDARHTRSQGFVISYEDVTPGIAAVGAPIYGRNGQVVAAISLSGLAVAYTSAHIAELADAVRAAGSRLSHLRGFSR